MADIKTFPARCKDRDPEPAPKTAAEFRAELLAEVKALARRDIEALIAKLGEVETLAGEIALGGECFPAGVRDICRRLTDEVAGKAATIQAIAARAS